MSNVRLTLVRAPENFQLVDILIAGNGIADFKELHQIALPGGIDFRFGVILNGRAPIWLYAYLAHLCHPAAWVAVMDPRHGAIVIEAHHPEAPPVGSLIGMDRLAPYVPRHAPAARPVDARPPAGGNGKVIGFVGPPHSGKSVLVRAIHRRLQERMLIDEFQREVFLVRTCPDGEGNWFGEISPQLAKTLRYKARWDDGFANEVAQYLDNLGRGKQLLLVDLGGKIDRRTQQILNRCTHAVIVSHDAEAAGEWRGALQASGVPVLAEIDSVLAERAEVLGREPLRLCLGPLARERQDVVVPSELLDVIRDPSASS